MSDESKLMPPAREVATAAPSANSQLGPDRPSQRRPAWLRMRPIGSSPAALETRKVLRDLDLHTVCEEAACPNLGECWSQKHATVMILGSVCTRKCGFCNVKTGRPDPVDFAEPARVAQVAVELGLRHLVITSVDRDDLSDGGAGQFVRCIEAVRALAPHTTIEVLTPDFQRKVGALERVVAARPDVFNHNLETVPRLYRMARRAASYTHSLHLLAQVKQLDPQSFTKSGIMLGLGETYDEVLAVMEEMRAADIDFITIGQYLRPTQKHLPMTRYAPPEEFEALAQAAREKGFLMVSASPLTRSSYHADRDFAQLVAARRAKLAQNACASSSTQI